MAASVELRISSCLRTLKSIALEKEDGESGHGSLVAIAQQRIQDGFTELKSLMGEIKELFIRGEYDETFMKWSYDLFECVKACCLPQEGQSGGLGDTRLLPDMQANFRDVWKDSYIPLVLRVVEVNASASINGHICGMRELGMEIADVVGRRDSRASANPRLIHYGLANAIWTGLVSVLCHLDENDSIDVRREDIGKNLVELLGKEVQGSIKEEYGRKLMHFWLSHLGKLGKNSPEVGSMLAIPFWKWMVEFHTVIGREVQDLAAFEPIGKLAARVIAVMIAAQSPASVNSSFVAPLRRYLSASTLSNHRRGQLLSLCLVLSEFESLWKAKHSELGTVLLEELLKACINPEVQKESRIDIYNTISEAIIEVISVHGESNESFERVLAVLVRFTVCPHPILHAVMSRTWTCIARYGSYDVQELTYSILMSLLRMHARYMALTSSQKEMEPVLSQLSSIISVIGSLTSDRLLQKICCIPIESLDRHAYLDRCHLAEITYTLKSLPKDQPWYYRVSSLVLSNTTSVAEALGARELSDSDEIKLVSWLFEVATQAIMTENESLPPSFLCKVDEFCTAAQRLAENAIKSESGHSSTSIFKFYFHLENLKTDHMRTRGKSGSRGIPFSMLQTFSRSSYAASTQIKSIAKCPDTSPKMLRSIFTQIFEGSASEPLRIASWKAYVEYIRRCPKENITAVLPDSMLDMHSGSLKEEVKWKVEQYLTGNSKMQTGNSFYLMKRESLIEEMHARVAMTAMQKPASRFLSKEDIATRFKRKREPEEISTSSNKLVKCAEQIQMELEIINSGVSQQIQIDTREQDALKTSLTQSYQLMGQVLSLLRQ